MIAVCTNTQGQLKVLSNGNVGVGVSSPASKLDIYGEITQNSGGSSWLKTGFGMGGILLSTEPCRAGLRFRTSSACGGDQIGNHFVFETGWGSTGGHGSNFGQGTVILDMGYYSANFKVPVQVNGITLTSDKKVKDNIVNVSSPLSKILSLRGVNYDLLDSIEINNTEISLDDKNILNKKAKRKIPFGALHKNKNTYGFIAQEMELVLPNLVNTDSSGLKSVNYIAVIPILVEALKEQNKKIETLEAKIAKLENKKAAAKEAEPKAVASLTGVNYLYQNTPNPFNKETQISFSLVQSINEASIFVYDLNGTQLKALKINPKTDTSVTIQASELRPGMYIYALVADGNIVDTKRMVIVE